jgi:hypothetical protein
VHILKREMLSPFLKELWPLEMEGVMTLGDGRFYLSLPSLLNAYGDFNETVLKQRKIKILQEQ